MKEELILYKQAKEARELTKSIVRDLLSVNLRKDRMSQVFLYTLERKVDGLIRQSQALKQKLRQLASELEQDQNQLDR
ncbi:MAG: hypothetical protein BRC33_03535 [Cyanobacteria bacterium SW_9_44_58]|nr:MAG: hypothetical protein BRC33_03535 [Cyanobacteria bacterium SW_9_44_58]